MMKKVFLLLAVALLANANYTQGQEKALKQYGFWDNWFIQGQVGGQCTLSEHHKQSSFGDKLSPNAALSVGKFFSPEMGARIQLGGWTSGNYTTNHSFNVDYLNVNADALFNLTNIFLPYKEDRTFNLIGIMGLGYVNRFKKTSENINGSSKFFAPRIGLQTDFKLNDAVSLNLEANANFYHDSFNGIVGGTKYDAPINVLAGITYRFKNRGFKTVDAADPTLIQSLNDQINAQRGQIDELKACCDKKEVPAEPKTIIKEVPAEKAALNSMVCFRIGKAKIDATQEVSIYQAAQYLKQNPDAKIVIASYCDKKTGTAKFNQKLSEKRSAAVAKVLKEKYGINESRFIFENNGDKKQPFSEKNAWNRVTIMTSK
ncbi:OmpA family protein [uncultured Bacteroides sp.]|uniref:OmpA family protein n=1 Tax=uncultured Bacteroides sp. TaxID=162156 RepID=UPI002AAC1267|nr:OmpA family protein [uncultured Bacteroides sp.]